ncbi:MAG: DAK2 domain-containing protein [Dehalococcoidia bacterium]|nr:DAK2 domain-containing protein [Dehalococcoidia bacterium]MDH5782022.1 DAK2 domain-containing protein [Dehalococcoidia bacterium]
MGAKLADGKILRRMFALGTTWLEKCVPEINAINVFPVPDGDTGTNMLLTMHSAMQEAKQNTDSNASSIAKSMAYGALMGARGNSGVILSQFLRGLAKGLEDKKSFNGKDFAKALAEASQAAYEGIMHPVEGTILTVLKDAAYAADIAAKTDSENLLPVVETATEAARDSVAQTPDLLPVLREAGVVDAGGQGLYVLLDGARHFLKGEADKMKGRKPQLVSVNLPLASKMAPTAEVEVPYGYCIEFLVEGQKINLGKIRKKLKRKGQSLIVAGNCSMVRVHIHSFKPGEILDYATHLGTLHQVKVKNMDDQYAEFIKIQKERMPRVDIAIVTVAAGDGFFEVFNSLGATIIVPGGQTMNPSVGELLKAVEAAPSDNIILLPNNKNIIHTASQVESLTSKRVKVIPTRTIPQGIAASLAFSYDMDLEENAQAMEEAMTAVKTIEVTKAVRKTQMNGQKIKKGQPIAILNDENLIAGGNNMLDIIFQALTKTNIENTELVTIYYAAEAQAIEAEDIAQKIREGYRLEVEVVQGGQPHYNYIISLE